MAATFLRLNGPARPNKRIGFIHSSGVDSDEGEVVARLESLAAVVEPVMAAHSLTIGRLTDAHGTGNKLPVLDTIKIFSHEIAQICDMTHSAVFRTTLETLVEEFNDLAARRWTGGGLWGRGERLGGRSKGDEELPLTLAFEDLSTACSTTASSSASHPTPPSSSSSSSRSTASSSTTNNSSAQPAAPSTSSPSSAHPSSSRSAASTRSFPTSRVHTLATPSRIKHTATSSVVRGNKTKRRDLEGSFGSEGHALGGSGKSAGCQARSAVQRGLREKRSGRRMLFSRSKEILVLSDSD